MNVFQALENPIRRQILIELERAGEMRIATLTQRVGRAEPTIVQSVNVLASAGLVSRHRRPGNQGRKVVSLTHNFADLVEAAIRRVSPLVARQIFKGEAA